MLRKRVVTAILMASAFLVGVNWLSVQVLATLFAVVIALGAWEWSSLAELRQPLVRGLYVLVTLVGAAFLYRLTGLEAVSTVDRIQPVLGFGCFWWCLALLWVRSFPKSRSLWDSRLARALMGLLILLPAWLAAVYLLQIEKRGAVLVVMVLIVAAADIGAYFTGRAMGRHALAPAVSPGKTWEGMWGGVVSVCVLAAALWSVLPPRFDHLSLASALLVALATCLASVLGDLTVSMVKRSSGMKDSGSLLPGHGGLLDRLDSLCAAAPAFALSLILVDF
ncbi:MAG: phosphatidate cytidylyltransferase [Pseudomonadota bacterium]